MLKLFPGDVPSKEWADASKPLHMKALGWGGGKAIFLKHSERTSTSKHDVSQQQTNNRLHVWA